MNIRNRWLMLGWTGLFILPLGSGLPLTAASALQSGEQAGRAVVTLDTAKQNLESLSKFIVSCGHRVKETKVV